MAGWENFLVAEVGASAALAGLVFVSISINLTKIMSIPGLPDRGLEALGVLLSVLVVSSLLLVPDQSTFTTGVELVVVGAVIWIATTTLLIRGRWALKENYRVSYIMRIVLGQVATVPLLIAGIALLTVGWGGLHWIVPAVVSTYLLSLLDVWVLAVEINR